VAVTFLAALRGIENSTQRTEESVMEQGHDQGMQDEQGEGKLTDELLEEKLREGKGPLPFIPGGEKSEPPVPQSPPEDGNKSLNKP
jgi:hypothetical protein